MVIAQNRWFSRGGNYKWKGESGKLKVALSLFASLLFAAPALAEFTCEPIDSARELPRSRADFGDIA